LEPALLADLAAGPLLAADLLLGAAEPEAAGADGEAGEPGVEALAAGLLGVAAADELLSALGVDGLALGAAGAAFWVWSADFDDADLEEPPEQAAPTMASVLNKAT